MVWCFCARDSREEPGEGEGALVVCGPWSPFVTSRGNPAMEEAGGAVVEKNNFARKLGSADKKTREKGLSLLVLWLSCQKVTCCVLFLFFLHRFASGWLY